MQLSKIMACLAAGVLCLPAFMAAQSLAGLGAINGSVRDASGASVPAANVVVANPQTGLRRTLQTNEAGLFSAPSLTPGSGYEVSVTRDGFATYQAKDIVVQVGQNVSLNVVLSVQSQAQEITVTEATPVVDSLKTGVSEVVDDKLITNLPINGRRVDSFVLLTPGVDSDGTFGLLTFRGVPGGNAFLTDGNDTTQGYYNENAGRTRISSNLSQDAVQEFQVQTSGMTAEFGRASGGSVNTVTKSGTNQLHGTGYWFFRNRSLNARDRYAFVNPREVRHQFGGSLGGAIRKDKLFYFLNGDFTRRDFPLVSTAQNPQLFTPNGQFIGQCTATAQQCQNAINYFQRFFGVIDRKADQDTYFAKLDYRPNEKNAFSASFNLMNWISPNGIQTQATLTNAGGIGNNGDSTVRHRFARLTHTRIINPNLVNEFRFGWFKDRLYDTVNSELAPPNGLMGQLSVQGQGNLGVADFLPRVQPTEDRFQFANNLTWLTGRHNFKFGMDFAHTRDQIDLLLRGRGFYTYGNFTAFAQDLTNLDGGKRWQSYRQTFGASYFDIFVRDYNFFAQDQWRATRRLTLNYGMRYEYAQFAQPSVTNPAYPLTGQVNQPGTNFAPRFGFALTLDNHDKTVLRGGWGMFYARMPGALLSNIHQGNGIVQKDITLQGNVPADLALGPVFPAFLPALDRDPPQGSVSLGYAAPDLQTPYTMQWDLGIERQLDRNTGVTVSYLGSRGVRFFMSRDLNVGAPGPDITYRILDAAGNQVGTYSTPGYIRANRIDQRYLRVNILENSGQTWYNALAVQLRRRAGKWMTGLVSYTWSHAQDYNQGAGNNNLFITTDFHRTVFNGVSRVDRGTSNLDLRHRLVMSGLVTPPRIKSDHWAVNQILNGWQLSMIATITSTRYTTPTLVVTGGAPFTGAAFNSSLNGFGGDNRVPFLGRMSLPIDNQERVDARLSKVFRIGEPVSLFLNFEAFNVFGNVYNTAVFNQMFNASGGAIRPAAGVGTGSASQGFPDGTNARRAQVSMRVVF